MTIRRCKPSDRDPDRPAKDQVWCLYSKDEDKLLGRHPTKEKAEKQERAVQIQKARSKGHNIPKKSAADSDADKDAATVRDTFLRAADGIGTVHVYAQETTQGYVVLAEYSVLPDTDRATGYTWGNNPHALLTISGYNRKGERIPRKAELHVMRSKPENLFKGRKGSHDDVILAIKHQAADAVSKMQYANAKAATLRRVAKALEDMLK